MNRLPEPQQPIAAPAEHPTIDDQAQQLLAAVEEAMRTPTSYRDPSPLPTVGPTPPVPQPGRPPMSQRATDASALILSGGIASLPIGAAATGILWASGHADPAVIALVCAAPTTLVLALCRLMKRAKQTAEAAPAEHHHHYNGPVCQDHHTVNTQTRGIWAKTTNELPR